MVVNNPDELEIYLKKFLQLKYENYFINFKWIGNYF